MIAAGRFAPHGRWTIRGGRILWRWQKGRDFCPVQVEKGASAVATRVSVDTCPLMLRIGQASALVTRPILTSAQR